MPGRDRIAGARRWLRTVVDAEGRVPAWQAAFAYPEAGGLLLRLWCDDRGEPPLVDRLAGWLMRELDADAIGKAGARYTFDLAIVLAGLAAHAAGREPDARVVAGLQRLGSRILAGVAREPTNGQRWSGRFGPHLRKAAVALVAARGIVDPAWSQRIVAALRQHTGGGPVTPWSPTPGADATYVHAAAYALEGELLLDALGHPWRAGDRDEAMAWLSHVQRSDGGMPAWWSPGRGGFGPARSDATAQAVRLWSAIDRRAHADAIDRALAWLDAHTDPDGAVRYASDCGDRNVWATVFACQAYAMADGVCDPLRLL